MNTMTRWALMVALASGLAHAGDARPRLFAQLGHSDNVKAVALSTDGRFVLTSAGKTACLWEAATGREIRRFEAAGGVESVSFSADDRFVLTGSTDRTARLWNAASGEEVRRFEGHSRHVTAVAISSDGRFVLTGSSDKTARLWDAASGKEIRRFRHSDAVLSVGLSADGRLVLTGGRDKTARLWDATTGEEVFRLTGHSGVVQSTALSPDGRFAVSNSYNDAAARLWDATTGKEIRRFACNATSVAISADGRFVVTGCDDGTSHVWDAVAGKEVRRFEGHSGYVASVSFSASGQRVLTGGTDKTARLWDAATGKELRRFEGRAVEGRSVSFSVDGRFVLTGGDDGAARLWDTATGKQARRFVGHSSRVRAASISSDGRVVLTGSWDDTARLWDAATGREIRRFEGHAGRVESVVLSRDGRLALTGSGDRTARLWDTTTGVEIHRLEGHVSPVHSVAFSADGRLVLTADDKTAFLWDAGSGTQKRRFQGRRRIGSVSLSADGRLVLTGSSAQTASLWDAATGREIHRFEGHADRVSSVSFSSDGRFVLTGSWDDTARLWDAATGKERRRFEGHVDRVQSVSMSPDGRFVLTSSEDKTVRLWGAASGEELCRLIGFLDGTWAVVDAKGRFDASNGGDIDGLHWVVGNETISLDQLKERYYDPGLLAKILGHSQEPLREVGAFTAPKLYPEIAIDPPTGERASLGIRLRNRGGGIGRVVVKVNGKELTADARGPATNAEAAEAILAVDLAGDPRLIPGEKNTIEVTAFNAEGYLRSRGLKLEYVAPGEAAAEAPHLWAVVVGASDYLGDAIDLRYAAKDAADFARALRIAGARLFGEDRVHVAELTTGGERRPTRAALVAALRAAAKSRPGDLLVVYLSGHGVNFGGQEGDFYYLTADARSADLTDPEVREQVAISSAELTELVKEIPALKQVLILDTCASGKLVEKLTERRNVPGSQVRALERMKDRTGLFVLAGCASDRVSYEATRYAQGLLTHSLLMGMKGAALREDEYVDVSTLLGFAADKVPELAKDIGGVQRPIVAAPRGGASFDIGRLTDEDKGQVPLQAVRPLFLRSNFQQAEEFEDLLALAKQVDRRLGDASSRGAQAALVFVDAREFPDAYRIAGQYEVENGTVTVRFRLFRGKERSETVSIDGSVGELARLAGAVVEAAQKLIK